MNSREGFEAWYLDKCCGGEERLKKCHNDSETYYYSGVQAMWVPWKASREAIEVELPKCEYANSVSEYSKGHRQGIRACRDAIESLGLKVKL